jgi:putative ABC transport system permease protein
MSTRAPVLMLAIRDWVSEWRLSACLALGVAAIAAPLLMLFALRSGVVDGLRQELTRNPSSRELRTLGQPRIDMALVRSLAARPDVAFVAPTTRYLSASAVLRSEAGATATADLAPSGPGDPLAALAGRHPGAGETVLSERVARELSIRRGDRVRFIVNRVTPAGAPERASTTLRVVGVLPAAAGGGRSLALVPARLLLATEIYRETAAAADLPAAYALAGAGGAREYAGLRLFARTVDQVAPLRDALLREGVETEGRLDEIRLVQRLDQALTLLFLLIAGIAGGGLFVSLGAAQWAWVERKRRELGFLRLIGLTRADVAALPALQGLATAGLGVTVAAAVAFGGDLLADSLFAGQMAGVDDVSRLRAGHVLAAFGIALPAAVVASLFASAAAGRVTPSAVMREERA